MIWKSFGYVLVAAVMASTIPACSSEGHEPSAEVEQTGSMTMPLEATAPSGTVYRLRYAQFFFSGPFGAYTTSPPDDSSPTFTQVVESGDYYIELFPGWQLWRMTDEQPVEAVLLSSNPTWTSVLPDQETVVQFKFQAGNDIIVFGPGALSIDLDVVEANCSSDMDCSPGQYCQSGVCTGFPCMGYWDCPAGLACFNGQCLPGTACGNGYIEPGEACDDGNNQSGDGCDAMCMLEGCGNAVVEPWEQCDDGNLENGDGCSWSCTVEACGNGILDPGEQCDDGSLENGDGCDAACMLEVTCGNGIKEAWEECDDGNNVNGDGCDAMCILEPFSTCGNAVIEPGEACDDGNNTSGDGCASGCLFVEPGFVCPLPGQPCEMP